MRHFSVLICGLLFGAGLHLSGMTDPGKVRGFLDLFGHWVPDLLFVMLGALAVTIPGLFLVLKRSRPLLTEEFHLPSKVDLDRELIVGAVIFGIGWGLYGFCPGPVIASLAYLDVSVLVFVVPMVIGMFCAERFSRH